MTKRCSLNVYCIDSEKNYIPEDQLLTCVLPDMLPLQVKWMFGIGLWSQLGDTVWEWTEEGGRGKKASVVLCPSIS